MGSHGNPFTLFITDYYLLRFGVTDEIVGPFLEGLTIQEAIEVKKLYYVDYDILQGLPVKKGTPVSTQHVKS